LQVNWRRRYDPSLGLYTEADSLGGADRPGLYGYASLRPLGLIDWDGRQTVTIPGNEEERCKRVIEACRVECTDKFAENPDDLPGSGHDYSGRMHRCIRECAAAQGCDF
jgi:hypothetical protein